jgi:hypothetical protein
MNLNVPVSKRGTSHTLISPRFLSIEQPMLYCLLEMSNVYKQEIKGGGGFINEASGNEQSGLSPAG